MNENAEALRKLLIRNFNEFPAEREVRPPLYDSVCARLARGTAARKLGASFDTVAPGMRSCPYHLHYAQEEMFIVEGSGTPRVAGRFPRATSPSFRRDRYPHQIINTSDAPSNTCRLARAMPELCEYPDSDKFLAMTSLPEGKFFDVIQRKKNSVDYWDGEP
jgi:uncharacterized cupin superfamily protein